MGGPDAACARAATFPASLSTGESESWPRRAAAAYVLDSHSRLGPAVPAAHLALFSSGAVVAHRVLVLPRSVAAARAGLARRGVHLPRSTGPAARERRCDRRAGDLFLHRDDVVGLHADDRVRALRLPDRRGGSGHGAHGPAGLRHRRDGVFFRVRILYVLPADLGADAVDHLRPA